MEENGRFTPSVIAYGDDTFPKGTASAVARNFAAAPKGVPLGELAKPEALTEGVTPYNKKETTAQCCAMVSLVTVSNS